MPQAAARTSRAWVLMTALAALVVHRIVSWPAWAPNLLIVEWWMRGRIRP